MELELKLELEMELAVYGLCCKQGVEPRTATPSCSGSLGSCPSGRRSHFFRPSDPSQIFKWPRAMIPVIGMLLS
jgi:hypothetical protein